MDGLPAWLAELAPILILLAVIAAVIYRFPGVALGHSAAFRRRRFLNWFPLGLTYAFLYMGRYNLKVSQHVFEKMPDGAGDSIMGNSGFATVFGVGTAVYGVSFVINGPLTDRYGGKAAILVGAAGACVMNALMGLVTWVLASQGEGHQWIGSHFLLLFSLLYAGNMYFQSFGAVAIVKVNAPWFHVNERGVFGAIFGVLISLGIYFAFDWGYFIIKNFEPQYVFLTPAMLLGVFGLAVFATVKNTPGLAGHADFDTADASSGDDGPQLGALQVLRLMVKNPIIMTIAGVEFCSGFLRQAIMQWYRTFAKHTDGVLGGMDGFVYDNWGLLLCCAGIMGGTLAGVISDRVFGSRRGPVAAILYGAMLLGAVVMSFTFKTALLGPLVIFMSMAVIGVHGMLSGTASMDFGGRKNVGIAVGIIDGFVYAGTAFMALVYGVLLPDERLTASRELTGPSTDPSNWLAWPLAMIPVALVGLVLARRIWHAKPKRREKPEPVVQKQQQKAAS